MKTKYIGKEVVNDGYNGKKTLVHVVYDPDEECVLHVHPGGYYRRLRAVEEMDHGEYVRLSMFS